MPKRVVRKLAIKRETMANVGGGAWHRTSLRCHESYISGCYTQCPTQCPGCGLNTEEIQSCIFPC